MFGRENIVGILLLVLCGVVAFIMLRVIMGGPMPTVPQNLQAPLTVVGTMLVIYLIGTRIWTWFRNRR